MRDLYSKVKIKRAISPVSVSDTTAQVSQIIDTQGFDSLMFAIAIGSVADADCTFTILVEDGDNSALSDNAAVDDSQLLGTEALAAFQYDSDNTSRKIGYTGTKRYVRLTITPVANSSAAVICAIAILGSAKSVPQTSQST